MAGGHRDDANFLHVDVITLLAAAVVVVVNVAVLSLERPDAGRAASPWSTTHATHWPKHPSHTFKAFTRTTWLSNSESNLQSEKVHQLPVSSNRHDNTVLQAWQAVAESVQTIFTHQIDVRNKDNTGSRSKSDVSCKDLVATTTFSLLKTLSFLFEHNQFPLHVFYAVCQTKSLLAIPVLMS